MARKPIKKFGTGKRYADAGTVTKAPEMSLNDIRLRRKTDDIQSDYMKAQARHAGNTAKLNIAKAKFEQRMADAKDDMAKWSGSDRTATRKGEADAEAALTQARRTKGVSMLKSETPAVVKSMMDEPIETRRPSPLSASPTPKPTTARPAQNRPASQRSAAPRSTSPRAGTSPTADAAKSPSPPPKSNLEEIRARGAAFRAALASSSTTDKPAPDDKPTGPRKIYGEGVFRRYDNKPLGGGPEYVDTSTAASRARASAPFRAVGRGVGNTAKFAANYLNPLGLAANMLFPSEGGDDEGKRRGGTVKKKPTTKKPMMKYAKGGSIDGCAIRGKTRAKRT